jgi:sigma-54 dependent transcriptional regulator, flagellar regulatory protein
MTATRVLVIDSDVERGSAFHTVLSFIGCEPLVVPTCAEGRRLLAQAESVDVVLLGRCGCGEPLGSCLQQVEVHDRKLPVLMMGGVDAESPPAAAENLPFFGRVDVPPRYAQLSAILQQARRYRGAHEGCRGGRPVELFRSLVGESSAIRRIRRLIEQVAASDANVLILGESGTGKEVVARNIHRASARGEKAFVPINCGAIPAELLESELFGHEKGAFTGAVSTRQGRFELADGGTLFLDEIGDMSLTMQVKLLRVLQERTFERVGSNKSISVDVRIVAATHRNLEERIREGAFREDLFYRLNVFPIDMPSLRERAGDIPLLVAELVSRIENEGRGSIRFTPAALRALGRYEWPGNVRELANLVERLSILHPYGLIDTPELPEKFRAGTALAMGPGVEAEENDSLQPGANWRLPREGLDLKEHLSNLEANLIRQALEETGCVVAHAANLLRMRRTTLVEKLRKYGIQRGDVSDTPEI